ncbi:MAG: DUF547 domain-containing protein [Deltaproteobacteria bacterium]|nr:DUF547 domain-containing protein [Deltaproteobacteria bacterium]
MKIAKLIVIIVLSGYMSLGSMDLVESIHAESDVDNGFYGELLKKYVIDGVVDYQGFKNEEDKLDQYLKILENTNSTALSHDEQFAFYINAYNAWTIKLILSDYPGIKSIKDLGNVFRSPWKKKICRIDGGIITLDDIEHKILRPRFRDPRVHFAIVCASKSCPPLISEPYRGRVLNQQLDISARAFINNPERNRLEGNMLYVSSIFKWFAEDFNDDIIGFFRKYVPDEVKSKLDRNRDRIEIKYLSYDWSLNGG